MLSCDLKVGSASVDLLASQELMVGGSADRLIA